MGITKINLLKEMETCVLIPEKFCLAVTYSDCNDQPDFTVWTTSTIDQGTLFYPFQGTIRLDRLKEVKPLDENDIRFRFGLYDNITNVHGSNVRHCNWIRFLRVSEKYGQNVNFVCTKVKGEPVYEAIKSIAPHQELVVYYLPERPEELFCFRFRTTLYRQTMDSILKDSPLDLSTSLMHDIVIPTSSSSSSEDENKSMSSDSLGSFLSSNENIAGYSNNKLLLNKERSKLFPKMSCVVRIEKNLLNCEVCGKKFDRPSLLKRHTRTHTGEKPHVCVICGKGFSTSSSLNTHRRIHSGEKPHECKVCGKRFTASSNLYYHRMTHVKEKPHKCSVCAKSFPTPGDLKSHMYIHNGSWPFKCHICFRGFSKQTNLKNHQFLHTGDKPHCCTVCSKKFALACNLRAHLKTHEGDVQIVCRTCGRLFTTTTRTAEQKLCVKCIGKKSQDDVSNFYSKNPSFVEDESSSDLSSTNEKFNK